MMTDIPVEVPNDLPSEQSLLGAWLSDDSKRSCYLLHSIPCEAFYREEHILIAKAIATLSHDSKSADPVTVATELKRLGQLDKVGGSAYLRTLVELCPSKANVGYYAETIVEMAKRRKIIRAARDAYEQGFNPAMTAAEARATLSSALADDFEQRDRSFMDIAREGLMQFEDQEAMRGSWPTPRLGVVSNILDAFRPGRTGIVAGLPGTGKSSIAAWWVLKNAEHMIPCAFISLEMDRLQVFNRLVAGESGLENEVIDRCRLSDADMLLYAQTANDMANYPVRIIDDCPATEEDVLGAIQRSATIHGCRFVVVDYLQLVYSNTKTGNRNEELARFTARLKTAAKALNVYILEVSQLSRDVVKESRKPRLQDLRDSGGLEQNADDCLLLSEMPNATTDRADILCDIAKHRSGKRGVCALSFDKKAQRWAEGMADEPE